MHRCISKHVVRLKIQVTILTKTSDNSQDTQIHTKKSVTRILVTKKYYYLSRRIDRQIVTCHDISMAMSDTSNFYRRGSSRLYRVKNTGDHFSNLH